jgi:general secretion pathway protein B
MSYILDALRKSERDRRQNEAISLGEFVPTPTDATRISRVWIVTGVAAVAVVVLIAVFWLLLDRSGTAAIATPLSTDPVSAPEVPQSRLETPPPLRSNPITEVGEPNVRDLAHEAQVTARLSPPERALVAPPAAAVLTPAPRVSAPSADAVKFLRAMPPEFQQSLPPLVVNVHVYSPAEAERILFINNEPYGAGQKVNDDLIVEQIVPDGVVMIYRGQRFKLPRPS